MKSRSYSVGATLLCALIWLFSANISWAQPQEYTHKQHDGWQEDVTVDGSLDFYDAGGKDKPAEKIYGISATHFQPKANNQKLRISFSSVKLGGKAELHIYDGKRPLNIESDDMGGEDVSLPSGDAARLILKAGDPIPSEFVSNEASGAITVVYKDANSSATDWEATVSYAIPDAPMTLKSFALVAHTSLPTVGRQTAPLAELQITTDGQHNPLSLSALSLFYADVFSKLGVKTDTGEVIEINPDGSLSKALPLVYGLNRFAIVGDISPSAQPGSNTQLTLQSISLGGTQHNNTGTSLSITLTDEVWMSERASYIVAQPLRLFDQGGPKGKPKGASKSLVTFVPAENGKVIEVSFSKLDLFTTASFNNDVLEVYEGKEKVAGKLIATYLKELGNSTSNDPSGALTILHHVKVGDHATKDGFEATITPVAPQAMMLKSATATLPKTLPSLHAGKQNVEFLTLDIITEHAQPAAMLKAIELTLGGATPTPLHSISLYQGNKLVGSSTNLTPTTVISVSPELELKNGSNPFTLKLSVLNTAEEGKVWNITASKVISSAGEIAITQKQPAEGKIENKITATIGTQDVTLEVPFALVHERYLSYLQYDTKKGQRIIHFIAKEGEKVVLDFNKFDLSFISYQPTPSFKVFDGATQEAALLFEATKENAKKGPEHTLLSTGRDMLVVIDFNGGPRGNGFEIKADSYKSSPMSITATTQEAAGSSDLPLGSKDIAVAILKVTTQGDLSPIQITALKVKVDSHTNIASLALRDEKGKTLGSADVTATETVIPFSEAVTLVEGESSFELVTTVAGTAIDNAEVTFSLLELRLGDNAQHVITPAQAPIKKHLKALVMQPQEGKKECVVESSIIYYDKDGEANWDKTAYESTITFLPGKEGEIIRFDIEEFNLPRNATFKVYHGKEVNADKLIKNYDNYAAQNEPYILAKESEGGAITVHFSVKKSSLNIQYSGWKIRVSSLTPRERFVENITVDKVVPETALIGAVDIPFFRIGFDVVGEKGLAKLPAITLVLDGLQGASLFNLGESDFFSPIASSAPFVGNTMEAPFTFEKNTRHYIFVAGNIPPAASENTAAAITLSKIGATDYNEKGQLTTKKGMAGEYTFGPTEEYSYNNLQKLSNDLNTSGVSGPVTITFEDGNYKGQLYLKSVPGAGKNNPITLTGKSKEASKVTFEQADSKNDTETDGLWIIENTPYVTVEYLTLQPKGKTYHAAIQARKRSHHFTARHLHTVMELSTSLTNKADLIGIHIGSIYDQAHDTTGDFLIEGCHIEGGYAGIRLTGASKMKEPASVNGAIRQSKIYNYGVRGIYAGASWDNLEITDNQIVIDKFVSDKEVYGIDVQLQGRNERITNNRLSLSANKKMTAVYLRPATIREPQGHPSLVANNSIHLAVPTDGKSATGILCSAALVQALLAHNTVRLTGANPSDRSAFAVVLKAVDSSVRFINNLVQSATAAPVLNIAGKVKPTMSHNAYFTKGAKFAMANGAEKTFESLIAYTGEQGALQKEAQFVSEESAALKAGASFCNGTPLTEVTLDITGAKRNTTKPTMGAYEFEDDTAFELGFEEVTSMVEAKTAKISFKPTRNAKLYHKLQPAAEATPTEEALLALEAKVVARGDVVELSFTDLKEQTEYKLYGVFEAISEEKKSAVLTIVTFTTKDKVFVPATFTDVKDYVEGQPFESGTVRFEGFKLEHTGDMYFATTAGKSATVTLINSGKPQILNTTKVRAKGSVTITNETGKSVTYTTLPDEFVTIDLQKVSPAKSLTIVADEAGVALANFGAEPEKLTIDLAAMTESIKGAESTISANIQNAVVPYKYQMARKEGSLKEGLISAQNRLTVQTNETSEYLLQVEDARGRKSETRFFSVVHESATKASVATFEQLVPEDGKVCRAMSGFYSGSYYFNLDGTYLPWWSGFAYSESTETGFDPSTFIRDQYNVPAGGGVEKSTGFCLAFMNTSASTSTEDYAWFETTDMLKKQKIAGVYLSLNAYTLNYAKNAEKDENGNRPFQEGDFYELVITADNGQQQIIPLIDYREGKRDMMDKWTWIDLSMLGEVKRVSMNARGSISNEYGLLIPAYVALDNLGAEKPGIVPTQEVHTQMPSIYVAQGRLNIAGGKGLLLEVYDLSGARLLQTYVEDDRYVAPVQFPAGNYIVRCGASTTKIVVK